MPLSEPVRIQLVAPVSEEPGTLRRSLLNSEVNGLIGKLQSRGDQTSGATPLDDIDPIDVESFNLSKYPGLKILSAGIVPIGEQRMLICDTEWSNFDQYCIDPEKMKRFEMKTGDLVVDLLEESSGEPGLEPYWVHRTLICQEEAFEQWVRDSLWFQRPPGVPQPIGDQILSYVPNWGNSVVLVDEQARIVPPVPEEPINGLEESDLQSGLRPAEKPSYSSEQINDQLGMFQYGIAVVQFCWCAYEKLDQSLGVLLPNLGKLDKKSAQNNLVDIIELTSDFANLEAMWAAWERRASPLISQVINLTLSSWMYPDLMAKLEARLSRAVGVIQSRSDLMQRRTNVVTEYILFLLALTGLISFFLDLIQAGFSGNVDSRPEGLMSSVIRASPSDVFYILGVLSVIAILIVRRVVGRKQMDRKGRARSMDASL